MPDADERLLRLFELEPIGKDHWQARTPSSAFDGGRLFGGQVAALSLRAATLTVEEDRPPHSLHAYFIRPGRPDEPMLLQVDRTRDGRSFTTRRVTATQSAGAIFTLAASFAVVEDGDDWHAPLDAEVPDPESVDPSQSFFSQFWEQSPFDVRPVHPWNPEGPPRIHPIWVRTKKPLPDDDPGLHAAVITFFSDMGVVGSARAPESKLPRRFMGASLDHAVWFHRPARADHWLLFDVEPISNARSRGLSRGTFHTQDGILVASIAQESLLRDTGRVPLP